MKNKVIPIILSGGPGSRLWPISREAHPKPFMELPDGESLLEKTYIRIRALSNSLLDVECATPLTVTNRDYYFMSSDVLRRVGLKSEFLLEPFGRNTAAAIGMAAFYAETNFGPETILLVMPADHLIKGDTEFSEAVSGAIKLAKEGYLVTFGINPTGPETGFGYIKNGQSIPFGHKVEEFVEKPSYDQAVNFLKTGMYTWNAGIFCFQARVLLEEMNRLTPELLRGLKQCWSEIVLSGQKVDTGPIEIPKDAFDGVVNSSIDNSIMEKSNRVAVVRGQFEWNDIGSWQAVKSLTEPVGQNTIIGDVIAIESSDNFIRADGRLIAILGVKNLFVIDSPDALLITDSAYSQDVKKVIQALDSKKHKTLKYHQTVKRPWGLYTILGEGFAFKIKRIEVRPFASLSLQMHHHRSEHWVVVEGVAKVVMGDDEFELNVNESVYIPAGYKHRLTNIGSSALVLIEVQTGDYLGEDDIVRYDDQYGRKLN